MPNRFICPSGYNFGKNRKTIFFFLISKWHLHQHLHKAQKEKYEEIKKKKFIKLLTRSARRMEVEILKRETKQTHVYVSNSNVIIQNILQQKFSNNDMTLHIA